MEQQRHQFDEQAALRALEQLRDQIESARSRREQKVAEFDAFVRSNRAASQAERLFALNERDGAPPAVQAAARTAERAADAPVPRASFDPRPWPERHAESPFQPFDFEPRSVTIRGGAPFWLDRRIQIGAGVAAVLLLLLIFAPWGSETSDGSDPVPAQTAGVAPERGAQSDGADAPASSLAAASASTPTAPNGAASAADRPLNVRLTTLRPVWMRVTVDGARTVERQVPGGQTLSFGADRAVALRVGDAGAVRLALDGADQGVLGRNGQVVNRTFTPRPR